jgi:Ni/Fe-hydrogenase subunit HybB-like protein
MRPLTVLTGFVMGSSVSIAVSLLFVLIVFALVGDEYPRVRHEFEPLTRSLGIFTAMTAISVGSFYTLIKNHPWRFAAQGLLWSGVFLTGWYYWP